VCTSTSSTSTRSQKPAVANHRSRADCEPLGGGLRWRRSTIPTDEALETLEAFASRHGGDERAALGELISILVERDARAS
jgi:hypothetical protein